MRSAFLILFYLATCVGTALAHSEKANTVLLHPGDVVYARFERKGRNLKLISATKADDAQAQVIVRFGKWDPKTFLIKFEIENKFDRELTYTAETRINSIKMRRQPPVVPVVEGKVAFEEWPVPVEELALFGFELSK